MRCTSFFLLQCAHLGFENNNKIDLWDFRYYASKIEESVFEVRQEEIMEYFPLYAVTQSIIKIYGELLGLKFTSLSHASKWHDDVQVVSSLILIIFVSAACEVKTHFLCFFCCYSIFYSIRLLI